MAKIPISKKDDKNAAKENGTQKTSTVVAPYSNEYVRKNPVKSRCAVSTPANQDSMPLTFQPQKTTVPIPFLTGEQLNVHSNALKNMRGVGGSSKNTTIVPSVLSQESVKKARMTPQKALYSTISNTIPTLYDNMTSGFKKNVDSYSQNRETEKANESLVKKWSNESENNRLALEMVKIYENSGANGAWDIDTIADSVYTSQEEKDRFKEMVELRNRTSDSKAFSSGLDKSVGKDNGNLEIKLQGMLNPLLNKIAPGGKESRDNFLQQLKEYSDYMDKAQQTASESNPLSATAGTLTGQAMKQAVVGQGVQKAVMGIPFLQNTTGVAKHVAGIAADLAADTAVETIPQLIGDISNGKSAKEVATNAGKSLGLNLAFNVGGDLLGTGIEAAKKLKATGKVPVWQGYSDLLDNMGDVPKKGSVVDDVTQAQPVNSNIPTPEKNIADNVASNPTLTAEFTPQQALRESNPLEYGENVKNSRYSTESIPNKSDLPDEVTQIFVDNPTTYNVIKNADTKAKADSILQSSDNLYQTVSEYKRLLDSKDPASIPLGYELSKQLIDSGDVDAAVDIIRDMSTSLTKSGQFTQAAAMTLLHENPQAAMRYAIKELDSINSAGAKKFGDKWKEISLTEDEINAFTKINTGDTEAIKGIYESIGNRIAKEYPATKWEKFVELTKISMLFNPRTHLRNSLSNAILLPMRSLSDRVSAIGMNAAHIINPDIKVTQSLTGSIGGKYKQGAEQVWETVKEGIVGSDNKWDDLSGSVFKKQVFKDNKIGHLGKKATVGIVDAVGNTKIVNHLAGDKISNLAKQLDKSMTDSFTENIRNLDYYLLSELEDNPFVKANFVNRLASYMKAQNITDVSQVPEDAISLATTEALKATFKDDNSFSRLLSNVKKDTGKFGEVLLPFTKTPANLAMRGIDYSPVGVINTIRHAKGKSLAATMDELSKNVVGTAAIYLGYKLAEEGLIQGALSDDKDEKEFQKRQGKQAFSVEVNGSSYTFDWAQPASIPMILGSVLYQAISEDDESNQSQLQKLGNYAFQGAGAAVNAWVELSPLQSIGDIFDTSNGKTVPENALNEALEFPIRLMPALGNAIANTRDTSQRTTFSNGDALGSIKNYAISKIPVLRETLPQTYDTWGKPVVNATSTGQAAFNNFISPGKSAVTNPTSIDSEIQRLYEETGNNAVFPRKAGWSVGDNKLTAEQHSAYQKGMGEVSYTLAEQFISSESYKNMTDEDKADTLNKLYGFSKALYESETFGTNLSSENAKYAEMYEYGGAECLVEYMEYKNVIGKNDIVDSDKMRDIWNEKGSQGIVDFDNIRGSSLKTNEDGTQSVDKNLLMQNLISSNMSEEEKGFWYRNIAGQTAKDDKVYADLGYEGVYRYHVYKLEADQPSKKTGEKNGQLSRKEVITYLSSTNMSLQEKHDWYNILVPIDDIPKNPY